MFEESIIADALREYLSNTTIYWNGQRFTVVPKGKNYTPGEGEYVVCREDTIFHIMNGYKAVVIN